MAGWVAGLNGCAKNCIMLSVKNMRVQIKEDTTIKTNPAWTGLVDFLKTLDFKIYS